MLRLLKAARTFVTGRDSLDDRPAFACLKYSVAAAVAVAAACLFASIFVNDVRVERALTARGVTTQARFLETVCGKGCTSLPVTFTTASGQVVHADVPASGDPDDDTILVRYDPQHPTHVHPANGVVADEVEAGLITVAALSGFGYAIMHLLEAGRMLRVRRRFGPRAGRPGPGTSAQVSHVKVVQP